RVLCDAEGKPLTQKVVQVMLRRAARRGKGEGGGHIPRPTFCLHPAMRGGPGRANPELAGDPGFGTTQRYMHLSPAAIESAIRLLETTSSGWPHASGEIVEAAGNRP